MRMLFLVLALVAGLGIGLYNFTTGDALVTAVLLAVAAFVLAVVRPSYAWMSATVIGLGVPLVYLGATLAGVAIEFPPSPNVAATLLALLPAVAAALLGLALRRLVLGAPTPHAHH
ncbi:MAG TPA: hypothetical protein VFK36_12385 [Gemmatimonadales bacterium]|nr:hypothetical protein [Gemmatimonadales bacterium]